MASHTPGPWETVGATKVWHHGEDGAAVAIVAEPEINNSSDIRPVEIYSRRFDEACANARLIAAAPDLLAALTMARKTLAIACGETAPYIRQALGQIDAAIAKAEDR